LKRKMKNKIFTIFFILFIPFFLWAQSNQNGSISGFIYDKSNGEALIGVSVYIKELRIGNITNTSGYYVIPKIPLGKYTIIYTYIGYKTDERKVDIVNSENRIMTISMSVQTLQFEEVVVTADSMRVVEKLFRLAMHIYFSTRKCL